MIIYSIFFFFLYSLQFISKCFNLSPCTCIYRYMQYNIAFRLGGRSKICKFYNQNKSLIINLSRLPKYFLIVCLESIWSVNNVYLSNLTFLKKSNTAVVAVYINISYIHLSCSLKEKLLAWICSY